MPAMLATVLSACVAASLIPLSTAVAVPKHSYDFVRYIHCTGTECEL